MASNRKDPSVNPIWNLAGLGAEFTGIILFHLFLFSWLDEKFATKPWLLLGGMILGFTFGIYHIIKRTNSRNK
jgi:F0F1-type ATP synthase assembly protein I